MRTGSPNGWQFFAATLLMMIGAVNIIQGLVALMTPNFYAVAGGELLFLEYGAWGLLLGGWGVVLVVAGAAILSGSMWARVFGIVLAAVNALAQLAFLVALPLWSVVAIAIELLVIYALTAGWPDREMAADRDEAAAGRMTDDQRAAYRSGRRAAHAKPEPAAPAEEAGPATHPGDRRHPV
ncbi:hypothetical protein ACFXKD_24255 [Nocardiopsis aegyptia]|uniref:DUF7144 family membrane protein n=1 Tax=Nocardiopsis aegyptia TaxID=220378 RepID=UPI0036726091